MLEPHPNNPNYELIKADPEGYREWLDECLIEPEFNEDGFWDEDGEFSTWEDGGFDDE